MGDVDSGARIQSRSVPWGANVDSLKLENSAVIGNLTSRRPTRQAAGALVTTG
jgi:hypothetical protein